MLLNLDGERCLGLDEVDSGIWQVLINSVSMHVASETCWSSTMLRRKRGARTCRSLLPNSSNTGCSRQAMNQPWLAWAFRQLGRSTRLLGARAWQLSPAVSVGLRLLGPRGVRAAMEWPSGKHDQVAAEAMAGRTGRLVQGAAHWSPLRPTCLERSLVMHCFYVDRVSTSRRASAVAD